MGLETSTSLISVLIGQQDPKARNTRKGNNDDWGSSPSFRVPLEQDVFNLSTRSPVLDKQTTSNDAIGRPNGSYAVNGDYRSATGHGIAGASILVLNYLRNKKLKDIELLRIARELSHSGTVSEGIRKSLRRRGIKLDETHSVSDALEGIKTKVSTKYQEAIAEANKELALKRKDPQKRFDFGEEEVTTSANKPTTNVITEVSKPRNSLDNLDDLIKDAETHQGLRLLKSGFQKVKSGLGRGWDSAADGLKRHTGKALGLAELGLSFWQFNHQMHENLQENGLEAKIQSISDTQLELEMKFPEEKETQILQFSKEIDGSFTVKNKDGLEKTMPISQEEISEFLKPILDKAPTDTSLKTFANFFGIQAKAVEAKTEQTPTKTTGSSETSRSNTVSQNAARPVIKAEPPTLKQSIETYKNTHNETGDKEVGELLLSLLDSTDEAKQIEGFFKNNAAPTRELLSLFSDIKVFEEDQKTAGIAATLEAIRTSIKDVK